MSAFARLGLPSTASESSIKRAYARLLRQTRPDDDPEGFQRLNEAYKEALAHCRSRTAESMVLEPWQNSLSEMDKSPPTAETGSEASPRLDADAPCIDITTICDKIIAMAEQDDMQAMQQWLAVQPELWSLPLKNSIGDRLLDLLQEREPPICLACSQALLEYFGFARVLSGYDPMFLHELQQRMHINWSIESNQEQGLADALDSDLKNHQLQRVLNQLRQPLHFWQWIPGLGAPDANIMLVLRGARISASRPPASLDQGQVAFWLAISDMEHLHRQHLALLATRFTFAMLVGLMTALFGWWILTRQSIANFVLACIAIAGLLFILWCTFKVLAAINRWHYCPEHLPIIWPWLCFGFIPLLCAGTLLCMALNLPIAATFLSGASAWLASQRLRRGYGPQLAYVVYLAWWFTTIWICFQLLAVHPWYAVASFMGMALLMWILDVVNHRHFLRIFHGNTA
ncbi:MAG TPA: hypothetical protein VFL78_06350 [Rhodanobacteraceae bacterium]|nr:hypothetical protein [Rhodanobacteraceae bacterium]